MPQRTDLERMAEQFRLAANEPEDVAAPLPTRGWDVFTGCLMLAPGTRDELSRLQAVLPGYDLVVTSPGRACRFEAVRLPGGPQAGPWCVVSSDPADLWRELAPWMRLGAGDHPLSARAP